MNKLVNLEMTNEALPVVETNYEVLRAALEFKLGEYKELEVTEDNLKDRKADQSQLASMRTAIDKTRKKKKKELQAPIDAFEAQCKDLIALIAETEAPLKKGIEVYDDKRRKEKADYAKNHFDKCLEGKKLDTKFINFEIPKECNILNSTKKSIRENVEKQVAAIELRQVAENEKIQTIENAIAVQNLRVQTKLVMDSFKFFIDSGMSLEDILAEIARRGDEIFQAEQAVIAPIVEDPVVAPIEPTIVVNQPAAPIEQIVEQPIVAPATNYIPIPTEGLNAGVLSNVQEQEIINESVFVAIPEESVEETPMYEVVFKVTGDFDTLQILSQYINNNKIEKEIISQRKL